MKKIIEVRDLRKSFKEKEVLKGINLSVNEGEICALLGSNGSGKTTMINILSTILSKDSGQAFIDDYEVGENPQEVRQLISLTGQFAALDEMLTGRENIEMMAKLARVKDWKARTQELLTQVSMHEAADERVSTYSGGMKRRIDIAMGLVARREILFLDEPTTGLDPEARNEIYELVEELTKTGVTIFLTTQYLQEAEKLADHIAILHEGKISKEGSLEKLQEEHSHLGEKPSLEEIFLDVVTKKEVYV